MADKPVQQGASEQRIGTVHRLKAWFANHQLVAVETLLKLLQKPTTTILTWLVVAIALTLPGALWMTVDNVQQLGGQLQQSGRMSVYLQPGISNAQGQQLATKIDGWSQVAAADYVSAEQALAEFQASTGLGAALELLSENPLPAVILVEPPLGLQPQALEGLRLRLAEQPLVDDVQVDMRWVQRLLAILQLGERMIWVLGSLLALAIVLVVGNTVRLSIAAHEDEIRVIKLVGGTNAYVRRPFLYLGVWIGMVGGLMCWLLLVLCWWLLSGPVMSLAELYGSTFTLQPLSAGAALLLLGAAVVMAWLGAWWSVSRHLHHIEPQA
ncbi:permease-like cell division protein FtsX [Bacterioplanes sanyensis]|nr:permease-like cell division protein FtsX [Bacterioplanes sanyensis]